MLPVVIILLPALSRLLTKKLTCLTNLDTNFDKIGQIEISSEADIYFLYIHEMNESAFREVQEAQRLTWAFDNYPMLMVKMLMHCIEVGRI